MIFQGIRTSIAKKPYIFVIFEGGGPEPLSPTLDPRMMNETNKRLVLHVRTRCGPNVNNSSIITPGEFAG